MLIRHKLPFLALIFFGAITPFKAAAADWVTIAAAGKNNSTLWQGRAGSFREDTSKSGNTIYVILGRITKKQSATITFHQWYVDENVCSSGRGKLTTTDISGNYEYDNDIILGGGTIASSIADIICGIVNKKNGNDISS
jgi:hypothetical protein